MYCFLLKRQPKSYNSKSGMDKYKSAVVAAFKLAHEVDTPCKDELYGVVYHFFKKDVRADADNISKPIWDSLTDFLFEDDRQVRLRIAGSYDLSRNDISILDFTGVPPNTVVELYDAFDKEEHFVYIECGKLDYSLFKLNLE